MRHNNYSIIADAAAQVKEKCEQNPEVSCFFPGFDRVYLTQVPNFDTITLVNFPR